MNKFYSEQFEILMKHQKWCIRINNYIEQKQTLSSQMNLMKRQQTVKKQILVMLDFVA